MSANAQTIEQPKFFDNINIGVDGGVTTPMNHGAFFGDMRGVIGIHVGKQITPTFGVGIEGSGAFNTSSWRGQIHSSTVFDQSYVGVYGTADLFNLFGGYNCEKRLFTIEALVGAGWGHNYFNQEADDAIPYNTFVTKAGLNLNAQINALREDLSASKAQTATAVQKADVLAAQLAACQSRKPEVIKEVEVTNNLSSVRFVFFRNGSSTVTGDQVPNVEMIADYMKNHPQSTVVIKGYASKDGNADFNIRLAKNRAESVKNMLVKRFKVSPDRITAEGEGIGDMFEEQSWNRVSICTLETK